MGSTFVYWDAFEHAMTVSLRGFAALRAERLCLSVRLLSI